jgi:hypothetical protein
MSRHIAPHRRLVHPKADLFEAGARRFVEQPKLKPHLGCAAALRVIHDMIDQPGGQTSPAMLGRDEHLPYVSDVEFRLVDSLGTDP